MGKKIIIIAVSVLMLSACGESGEPFHETAVDSENPAMEDCLYCHSTEIRDTHYSKAINNATGYLFDRKYKWAKEGLGYILENSEKYDACAASCHKFHKSDSKINNQWRRSAHGDPKGGAFTTSHGTWDLTCTRCHSGIGFAKYVSDNKDYPLYKEGAEERTQYYFTCNACHDAEGYPTLENPRLRMTGIVNMISNTISVSDKTSFDGVVNAGRSAACVVCHQSRNSGEIAFIKIDTKVDPCNATDDAVTGTASSRGFGSYTSHYLISAALFYGVKGFEYNGTFYTPGNPFHQSVGCVGCHMAKPEQGEKAGHEGGHTFEASIEVCKKCHGEVSEFGEIGGLRDLDGDGVPGLPKQEIKKLIEKIDSALSARNVYRQEANPYYYKRATPTGGAYLNWTEREIMAAYNALFVFEDKGAYVHNYRYAVQLLRDSYENMTGTSLAGVRPSTGDDRPNADYWDICP